MDKDLQPDPEPKWPWEDPEDGNTWTDAQRKSAKRDHLYPVAASLDDAGVSEDEVCRFLTLFGQSIGLGSFDHWQDRLYVWAEKHSVNKKSVDT